MYSCRWERVLEEEYGEQILGEFLGRPVDMSIDIL